MARRIVHVVLFFAGLAPAVWAICIFNTDPRRAAVLVALATLGLALNGTALGKPEFGLRIPLRIIACGVALVVLAGVLAMWQWLRNELLPAAPPSAAAQREVLLMQSRNLIWIAAAVGYVLLTILILPIPAGKPDSQTGKPKRIDFRKFGR